jgi:hypothetical protein
MNYAYSSLAQIPPNHSPNTHVPTPNFHILQGSPTPEKRGPSRHTGWQLGHSAPAIPYLAPNLSRNRPQKHRNCELLGPWDSLEPCTCSLETEINHTTILLKAERFWGFHGSPAFAAFPSLVSRSHIWWDTVDDRREEHVWGQRKGFV